MSIPCEVTKDLVSIYKDGVANSQTSDEIGSHLKSCTDCRQYYRLYDTIHYQKAHEAPAEAAVAVPSESFTAISTRLRRRHRQIVALITVSMAVLAAAIAVLGVLLHRQQQD